MKLKTIILTLGAMIALSAPSMALELQPGLSKQVLDSYYQTSRNMTLLRQKAFAVKPVRLYRVAAVVPVRVRIK